MKTIKLIALFLVLSNWMYSQVECNSNFNNHVKISNDETTESFNPPPPSNPPNAMPPVFPSDRIVFWVHGLSAEPEFLSIIGDATEYQSPFSTIPDYPDRKVTSLYPDYHENAGGNMDGAATSLYNEIVSIGDPHCDANNIEDKTINFVIGHSQGGLVARAVDKIISEEGDDEDKRFGGIVTFGTPHQGAKVLENIDDTGPNLAVEFAQDACDVLPEGPLEEALAELPFFIQLFIDNPTLQETVDGICSNIVETSIPMVLKSQTTGVTDDFHVGSPYLNALNEYESNIPMINFWGVEDEPVAWRIASSYSLDNPDEEDAFEGDYDESVMNLVNDAIEHYQSKANEWYFISENYSNGVNICSFFNWIIDPVHCGIFQVIDGIVGETDALAVRNAYIKGSHWLQNANNSFKTIIGAYNYVELTTSVCNCILVDNQGNFIDDVFPPAGCIPPNPNIICDLTETIINAPVSKPSDGVVLVESASNLPGASFFCTTEEDFCLDPDPPSSPTPNFACFDLPGSNHGQMRNDSNTKFALKRLFDGEFGCYFKTEERD